MSSKILFIGDPHIQPSNIEEGNRLMHFVVDVQREQSCDHLVIAGDLFHTHAVIRMEVQKFWSDWLGVFSERFKRVHVICGNHDMKGDRQTEGTMSALDPFKGKFENVTIWTEHGKEGELGFIPYTSNHERFISQAQLLASGGVTRLFCHQTFDGSKYDNGFYAPDGIDVNSLPAFVEIVSGHIHTEQRISNIFYPGTPKWDSMSDANQEKGIWISESAGNWVKISTSEVCTPIVKITVKEGDDLSALALKEKTKNIVELVGSSSWIGKASGKIRGKARIVARPTDSAESKKRRKTSTNIFDFLETYGSLSEGKEDVKAYLETLCLM